MPRQNQSKKNNKKDIKKQTAKKTVRKASVKKQSATGNRFNITTLQLSAGKFLTKLNNAKNSYIENRNPTKRIYIVLILLALLALFIFKKNLILAASVNGTPITQFELNQKLRAQYKDSTLNRMINEKIILDAAKQKGVTVGDEEIDRKISELESNVGGAESLNGLLSQQGQDRSSLKDSIKLQLTVEKMFEGEATVSAKEIQDFIDQNKSQLQASDSAGQEKEVTDILKQQKVSKVFNDKFQELKQGANVQIY